MTIGELYMDADGILYFLVSKRLMYKAFRGSEDLYELNLHAFGEHNWVFLSSPLLTRTEFVELFTHVT